MQAQLHRLSLNVDQNLREKSQFNDVTERIFHLIKTGDVGELEYYLSTHIKSEIVKHSLFPLHVNRRRQSVSSSAPPFLNVACELGHRSIAALLMEYGANPAQETEKGTPLYVATLNGHESIVQLLVQQKPELLYSVVLVRKALYAAASRGHVGLVRFWTNKLKKMDEFRKNPRFIVGDINPLQAALKGNHLEAAQLIIENKLQDVTLEIIEMFPNEMTNLMERWVQLYGQESQKLKAYWSGRGLHGFLGTWIKEPTYSEYLFSIDLSDNHDLRRIPPELIWSHPYLEVLDISNNWLESLPEPLQPDVSSNSRLVEINASRNELHAVPLNYFNLPNLQEFDLSRNLLTTLPKSSTSGLWQCPALSDLDISRNQLSAIPKAIEGAIQLAKLNIAYNKLTSLPSSWNCPLERLHAEYNAIESLPPDFDKFWKRTLQYLNLANNGVEVIPKCITELIALNSLKLSRNKIASLPTMQDWKVQRLKHLDLSHNLLVFHQPQQIHSPEQSSLSKLRKNFLSIRAFSSSSPEEQSCNIQTQTSLDFPAEIQDSLTILSLAHNSIEAVPDGISTMCSLAELDISGNSKIQTLPEELGLLKNLDILRFEGVRPTNLPQHLIPEAVSKKVLTKDVLRYLRNSLRKAVRHLGIKLLIVGPEKSGKTTLLASLKKVSKKDVLETKIDNSCINIGEWKLRNVSNKKSAKDVDIMVTYWDLSGAEKFDTINQCFLTPYALYLAVWDMTEGIEGIEKLRPHLLNIQARAPKSNVILVATHKDDYTGSNEDKQKLMEHIKSSFIHKDGYPHIDGVITLAATQPTSDAINKLRELIYTAATMLTDGKERLLHKQIPLSYIRLREKILSMKEQLLKSAKEDAHPPVMTEVELNELVKQIPDNDISTDDDLQQAVLFLNHTGTILHYNEQLHGLNTVYFLEPAWLSSILSVVTRLQPHLVEQGRIEKNTLKELLSKNGCRDDLTERYIQLLARFEIILPYDDNKFIIPSKLPKEKPGFILNTTKFGKKSLKIQRLYKMAFIPTGFWSRLVSRLIVNLQWLESTGSGNSSKHVRKKLRNMTLGGSTIVKRQSFIMAGFKWDGRQTIYWRQGIAVTQGGNKGFFIVEPYYFYPDGSMGISISIESYFGDFSPMGFIVDQIEMLIQEWYPGFSGDDILGGTKLLERLVLCSDCFSKQKGDVSVRQSVSDGAIHTFTLTECAVAVCTNAMYLKCPNHVEQEVPLKFLVPDLLLEDISVTKIHDDHLQLIKELNSGGFGVVYKAKYKMEIVAVKKYHSAPSKSKVWREGTHSQSSSGGEESKSRTNSLGLPSVEDLSEKEINDIIRSLSQLRAEVSLMSRLHHPFIVSLIGLSISKLCFAMEYAPHGDLMSYLDDQNSRRCALAKFGVAEQGSPLDMKLTYKIANQIACALAYLHKKSIIYCDLKTDNVLLWSLNVDDKINVKMTDYGISKVNIMQGVRTSKGAPGFRAPEVERGMTFDQKVDIFSYGMVLYHLLTGMPPFHDQGRGEISMAIRNNQRPGYKFKEFNVVPEFPHLEEIVQACWRDDHQARPFIGEVLTAFKDPSFLVIQQVIEHKEPIDCIYSSVTNTGTYELWTWTGTSTFRKLRRTSRKKEKEIRIEEKNIQGSTVTCMIKIGQSIILGSKTGRDGVIQVMTTPAGGMEHSEILCKTNLSSAPNCMTYAKKDDTSSSYYIFIGLDDGQLSIFKYEEKDSIDGPLINPPDWTLVKTMALNMDHEPCNCMVSVKSMSEIWIGSKNFIHIINCVDLNQLEPVQCGENENVAVKVMELKDNKLWCSCGFPANVYQYDVRTRKCVTTFHCSDSAQGWVITMDTGNSYKGGRLKLRSNESQDMDDSGVSESDNKEEEDRKLAFNFGHYSENDEEQGEKRKQPIRNSGSSVHIWGQQKNGKTYTEFLRENSHAACKIKALLVVKDTLWVGRSYGDILIINIHEDSPFHYKYGEVLGLISTYNLTQTDIGVVENFIPIGSDQVIASRLLPPLCESDMIQLAQQNHSAKPRQQLLYLKAWSSEDFYWFERNNRKLVETEVNWPQRRHISSEKKLATTNLDVTI